MTKVNTKVKKLPKSEVEIEGILDIETFEAYFNKALKKIGENVEIDGFRKGKVPENILLKNIPEIKILEQMAEMAISEHYPKILEDEKIDAISRPEITITKLARNNPLEFKIKTATMPEIKLPEYKEIAKKINSKITEKDKNIIVTDEDVEKTIEDIRKSRAPKKHMAEHTCEGEDCKHEQPQSLASDGAKEPELPEFNDEYVRSLGPFEGIEDFKTKLRANIKLEKENQLKEKTRLEIIEKVIEDSKIDVPEILIEIELDKILYRMESDIAQMGLKFDEYLKHLNKTIEDIRKEFRKDAEKKAKLSLVLNEISTLEKIIADEDQVNKEVELILNHYKDADPERARLHAQNVLTNEKIFQFLEAQ